MNSGQGLNTNIDTRQSGSGMQKEQFDKNRDFKTAQNIPGTFDDNDLNKKKAGYENIPNMGKADADNTNK
jgi:hypothetical protein